MAATPNKIAKQAIELLETRSKILRLRSQMRRVEEELDILKKPRGTLPRSLSEVPLHQRAPARIPDCDDVPGSTSGCTSRCLIARSRISACSC
jgi:transposase